MRLQERFQCFRAAALCGRDQSVFFQSVCALPAVCVAEVHLDADSAIHIKRAHVLSPVLACTALRGKLSAAALHLITAIEMPFCDIES
jgi:hypothetical protein